MTPTKGLVVFGKDGVSRKGASDAAASHYLTFPRLRCEGSVKLGAEEVAVTGEAWMDHEFSSSQLDAGQVGWDWTGVQLNDGSEIMCYRMRRNDGSSDPAGTTLVHVLPDGTLKTLAANEFQWQPTHSWTSPKTQTHYPIGARLTFSGRTLELKPLCDGQELDGLLSGLPYWEGACDVIDSAGQVVGKSFLELAGYAGDLGTHLRDAAAKSDTH